MRLSGVEIKVIKEAIRRFDPLSKVYLFGSRVNDDAKGGDIDLVVLSDHIAFSDKLSILQILHDKLGEQKIDLIIEKDIQKNFVRLAVESGVEL